MGPGWRSGRSLSGDTHLLGEDLRFEVFQWQFEAPITVVVEHLDRDQLLWTHMDLEGWSSHDGSMGVEVRSTVE